MNIAFIEPGLHLCGGIRRIIESANRLILFGHQVTIYTPTGAPCKWLSCTAPVKKLSKLVQTSYDAVIFNLADQYMWASKANATKKFFWVLAPEALYKEPTIPVKALKAGFTLLANSTFTVTYIKKFLPKYGDIPIIPGGINPEHFKYAPMVVKEYDVLYYGSSRPWKGTMLIEQAIKSLPGVKVLKMEGLNTPQEQMYRLYSKCTCYVSAGQVEGFSMPPLEAMACGCTVVSTDDGGSRDFIVPEINAIRVPRSVSGIAAGIKRVLGDKILRRNLIKEGLKTASQERYNWDSATRQLVAVLLAY